MTPASTVPVAGDRQVPWMKLLPKNWQFKPLKYFCQINASSLPEDTPAEQTIKYIDIGNVSSGGEVVEVAEIIFGEAPSRARRILASGDVFISTVRTYLTAIAYADAKLEGCICSTGFAVLTPGAEIEPRFLYFWTRLAFFVSEIVARSTGVSYPAINATEIGQLPFPVLARSEQRIIAAFLARRTAEIDVVVAKKERLIELLRDERRSLISHAVTKGFDKGKPVQASGIPWFGDVPQHWDLIKVGAFCRVVRGASPRPAGDPRYFNGNAIPWITVAEITKDQGKYLEATETFLTDEGRELSRVLPVGTFVLSNSGATLGVPKILKISGCINDGSVAFFDIKPTINMDFLFYFFSSQTTNLRERMNQGMGQPNLNTDIVRAIVVPVPPLREQLAICSHIDREATRIDGLVRKNEQQIIKLREYRQALISAAVTGRYVIPLEETPDFRAAVLAAEIVYRLHNEPHFGRTKLHKTIYGAEHDCDLSGIDSDYARLAFGPYDHRLQKAIEQELEARQWFTVQKGERGRITYVPLAQAGQHRAYFEKVYGDKAAAITRLIDQLRTLNKNKVERAMTLYAAWNDFLIRGEAVDDHRLLAEVQGNWHPEKKHKEESWRKSLAWLKSHKLIPHGFGKPTRPTDAITGLRSTAEDEADEDDDEQ